MDERPETARNRYSSRAISDNVLLQSEGSVLELEGDSETGLEYAIRAALDETCRAFLSYAGHTSTRSTPN